MRRKTATLYRKVGQAAPRMLLNNPSTAQYYLRSRQNGPSCFHQQCYTMWNGITGQYTTVALCNRHAQQGSSTQPLTVQQRNAPQGTGELSCQSSNNTVTRMQKRTSVRLPRSNLALLLQQLGAPSGKAGRTRSWPLPCSAIPKKATAKRTWQANAFARRKCICPSECNTPIARARHAMLPSPNKVVLYLRSQPSQPLSHIIRIQGTLADEAQQTATHARVSQLP